VTVRAYPVRLHSTLDLSPVEYEKMKEEERAA
jgi:hypothetical protein